MKNLINRILFTVVLYILITLSPTYSQSKNDMDMIYKEILENQNPPPPAIEISEFDMNITESQISLPWQGLYLYPNYPNPFNEMTLIEFNTSSDKNLKIFVSDEAGNEIEVLIDGDVESGDHFVFYKPSPKLKEGIYNCRMEVFSEAGTELIHSIENKMVYTKEKDIVLKK